MQPDEQSIPATMSDRVVVVYERVSTKKQDLARQAIQRDHARRECPDREIVVIPDDGVSAFKVSIFDRPGGRKLCDLIEAERVDAVYADAQDRLSRGDDLEWVSFRALCESKGTRIVIDGRELPNDLGGRLEGYLKALLARQESVEKGHRVKGGMRNRAERGLPTGGPSPYGYRYQDGGLVVVPDEAALVRRIFTEYLGGKSQRQIARDLDRDGVRTKRGGRWSQAIVARVIANPLYKGWLRYCGEEREARHEAIIDPALWDEAARLRDGLARTKGGGRGNTPKGRHLFRHGILRCGRCGEAMVPRTIRPRSKTGRWYEAYLCYGRIRDRESCSQPPVPREEIAGAFFRYFETVALDVDATRAQFAAEQSRQLAEAEALGERSRREEHEAVARLARVRRDYQDGKLDADDWRDQRDELTAELEAARAQAARLAQQTAHLAEREMPDAELAVLEYLTELRAAVVGRVRQGDNLEAVRAALFTLFDGFTLHRFDSESAPPFAYLELFVGVDCGYFLEPSVRADMVAQVFTVHAEAVAPTRIGLAVRENKEASGLPFEAFLPANKDADGLTT